jgi:hypothetical protein
MRIIIITVLLLLAKTISYSQDTVYIENPYGFYNIYLGCIKSAYKLFDKKYTYCKGVFKYKHSTNSISNITSIEKYNKKGQLIYELDNEDFSNTNLDEYFYTYLSDSVVMLTISSKDLINNNLKKYYKNLNLTDTINFIIYLDSNKVTKKISLIKTKNNSSVDFYIVKDIVDYYKKNINLNDTTFVNGKINTMRKELAYEKQYFQGDTIRARHTDEIISFVYDINDNIIERTWNFKDITNNISFIQVDTIKNNKIVDLKINGNNIPKNKIDTIYNSKSQIVKIIDDYNINDSIIDYIYIYKKGKKVQRIYSYLLADKRRVYKQISFYKNDLCSKSVINDENGNYVNSKIYTYKY